MTKTQRILDSLAAGGAGLVLVAFGLADGLAAQGGPGNGNGGGNGGNGSLTAYIASLPLEPLSVEERNDLIHMRQEEKLARDVYQTLYQHWQLPTFDNIAQSEQSHMDLVLSMLNRYGIADPLTTNQVGVYPDPFFVQVYQGLVQVGRISRLHAFVVGALIEDLDIVDLELALARADNRDIDAVWQNLQRGSRNHMRAFYRQLANLGFYYNGIYLSYAEIQAIVTAPVENRAVDENGVPLP